MVNICSLVKPLNQNFIVPVSLSVTTPSAGRPLNQYFIPPGCSIEGDALGLADWDGLTDGETEGEALGEAEGLAL